jgi:hypothetical protein
MKFLCDEMLGTLAKWLRILGYDAAYVVDRPDDAIIACGRREERIILTRDKDLAERGEKTLYISSRDLHEQVRTVVSRFDLRPDDDCLFSRCIVCNEPVVPVEKERVRGRVPAHVWECHERFRACPRCGRVYWQGTHYVDMQRKIRSLLGVEEAGLA